MTARILVVDDEPILRLTLERALRSLHYEVLSVGDPHLVHQLLDATDYDLVIVDINLPQMSGDTLAIGLLRRWPKLEGRILFMTGDPWALRAEWPEELRRCPMLVKPFRLDALGAAVQLALAANVPQRRRRRNSG